MTKITAASLAELKRLAFEGASLDAIAEELNIESSYVSTLARDRLGTSIIALRHYGLLHHLNKVIGHRAYIFEVRQQFDYTPLSFYRLVSQLGKLHAFDMETNIAGEDIPRLKESLAKDGTKAIDTLVAQGFDVYAIAAKNDLLRQSIQMYIRGSGQLKYWRRQTEERMHRHFTIGRATTTTSSSRAVSTRPHYPVPLLGSH